MSSAQRVESKIANRYGDLSSKLREAADYVAAHPVEVATRSLRSVSAASGVSPATLSRLARVLQFEDYEQMKELLRAEVGRKVISFSEKAEELRNSPQDATSILERQTGACMSNIASLVHGIEVSNLDRAVSALTNARQVLMFGAFGSTGIVEYMSYLAHFFSSNWTLIGRMGASVGASLEAMESDDVLVVVTKTPYARRAVVAAEIAKAKGAQTIIITDSHVCPANPVADFNFIVPSDSPQFFSSYAATLVLIETIIAMVVSKSEEDVSAKIRAVEKRNKHLGDFWVE